MDESKKPSNEEESQNQETTIIAITTQDTPAASDETKSIIGSTIINPAVSLAQGLTQSTKDVVTKVEGKVEKWSSSLHKKASKVEGKVEKWSSLLYKKPKGSEGDGSLPTSDEQVGDHEEAPRSIDENQPLVVLITPQTRTSWMNCCGLLDVFVKSKEQ